MKYFDNYKKVNITMLKESGIYPKTVIKAIERNDDIALKDRAVITKEQSEDEEYMGPIVYAYKELNGSYIVYKCCGDDLQKNLNFAIDIIREEPEIIEDTNASADAEFIQKVAPHKPEVIEHMSESLKSDTIFTKELCELKIQEVTKKVAQECKMPETIIENPKLTSDITFMKTAIKENENIMQYAAEELKNNYQFVKETCEENKEVINYVAEHTEEFGEEGINAAKEVLVENSTCRAIEEMKTELEKAQKEKSILESQEEFDENSEEYKAIKIKVRQLTNNIKFIERIKNGEVKQERAIRLINAMCENLDEEYRQEFLKYIKMDDAILERQNEIEEKGSENGNQGKTPNDIERITGSASLVGIKEETGDMRLEIERDAKGKIGEKTNDNKSENERS